MILTNEKFQVLTPEGFKDFSGLRVQEAKPLLMFELSDSTIIKCTHNHIFIIEDIEARAIELIEGDQLQTDSGLKTITRITPCEAESVFDLLDVGSSNSGYWTNGVLSHNCRFLGSTALLVDGDFIEAIRPKNPIRILWGEKFSVYENPVPGATYVLGVDSAEGVKLDSSVTVVLKLNSATDIEVVALYRNNEIKPEDYAEVVKNISEMYNDAYAMIEHNLMGGIVCNQLWNVLGFSNIVNIEKNVLGIKTTQKSKAEMCANLKNLCEKSRLRIYDRQIKHELSVFENAGHNIWKASPGNNDDTVMALMVGLFFIKTFYFDESDLKNTQKNIEMSQEMPDIRDTFNETSNIDFNAESEEEDIARLFGLFAESN